MTPLQGPPQYTPRPEKGYTGRCVHYHGKGDGEEGGTRFPPGPPGPFSSFGERMDLTGGSLRLFRAAGINVYLHWSWFVVAVVLIGYRQDVYHAPAWKVA